MLRVTFLGTAGAMPTVNRFPSAIVVNREGEHILLDCGEGAQKQMMSTRTGMNPSAIFLTHLHADHILGMPGLLQTLSLNGREEPVRVFGPQGTAQFVDLICEFRYTRPNYPVQVRELEPGEVIAMNGYDVETFRTYHGVPSLGYILKEPERPGRFDKQEAIELGVTDVRDFGKLQRGRAVQGLKGEVRPEKVMGSPRPGRRIVYTGDTVADPGLVDACRDADLLICEATFSRREKDRARETLHCTAADAAAIALAAGVRRLVLTHISSRYSGDSGPLKQEARLVFPTAVLAYDGFEIEVPLRDE